MPKISEEESIARRNEIIDACEALYGRCGYREITMGQIAERVSFGRANIYNYFQCKDEIFLALLQREHEKWVYDLTSLRDSPAPLTDEQLAHGLARTLESRVQMLQLMTMNLYDMEENSRLENLVEFKRVFGSAISALRSVAKRFKPLWSEERLQTFTYSFMPFMYGIYPYVFATDKQTEAMEAACVPSASLDIHGISYPFILKMLQD